MSTDQSTETWLRKQEEKKMSARRKTPKELRKLADQLRRLWA